LPRPFDEAQDWLAAAMARNDGFIACYLVFMALLLLAGCGGSSESSRPAAQDPTETQCQASRAFPRCVRVTGTEALRELSFAALSDYAGDNFYLNCARQFADDYRAIVRAANAIGADEMLFAGDQLVLPQPACGDSASFGVTAETRALLTSLAEALEELLGVVDEESPSLERLAEAGVASVLRQRMDRTTLGLDAAWEIRSVSFPVVAPVSPERQDKIIATLVILAVDGPACRERRERFVMEATVEGQRLAGVRLHRNEALEVARQC
jgi:hypothetical protein